MVSILYTILNEINRNNSAFSAHRTFHKPKTFLNIQDMFRFLATGFKSPSILVQETKNFRALKETKGNRTKIQKNHNNPSYKPTDRNQTRVPAHPHFRSKQTTPSVSPLLFYLCQPQQSDRFQAADFTFRFILAQFCLFFDYITTFTL